MSSFESLLQACRTPHKTGQPILSPSYQAGTFDSHAVDCPFPFFHEGRYWMTYVGWDSTGYRTGLACSDDLRSWKKQGLILDRGPRGSVTEYNAALTSILRDNALYGSAALKKADGRFLGTYHAYPQPGYEEGAAVIGLCRSDDLFHWEVDAPVLTADPSCPWEAGGLYKSWIMEENGTYYLFYNAKNRAMPWIEQTGVATSRDLVHWTRAPLNPILPNGKLGEFDDIFASDPCVLRHGDRWVMFYFGNGSDGHARDGVAFSEDLFRWKKSGEVLIDVGSPGSLDATHAHKPGIIAREGTLHHFYCAVRSFDQPQTLGEVTNYESRVITLATS
jgi:predicted GH43/DUF377 family glycosyl hydrolase